MAITPSSITIYGNEKLSLTTDTLASWSASGGTLYYDAELTSIYAGGAPSTVWLKPINKNGVANITCGAGSATVGILPALPGSPRFPVDWSLTKRGVVSVDRRDGSRLSRVMGDNILRTDPTVTFPNQKLKEYRDFEVFFADHFPNEKFLYRDQLLQIDRWFIFVAEVAIQGQSHNRISYSVQLREVPA
jgi:hypothetical protein